MAGVLSRLEILLHANTANFRRNMRRASDDASRALGDMKQKAAVVAKGMGLALAAVTGAAVGLAAVLVPVQRQFDIMNGQLLTATGSTENAAHAMEALNKFAAQTPYDLEQAVIGFTKLVNLGLTPSERAMTSYGNTASAMGKSMEQMIEAVADAATGEFERLKEFGIKASKEGDRVTFTFRGVKTEIGNSAAEIEKYLMDIGEVEFAGAMEAQMDTLNGRISQSEIALNDLKLAIAQSGIGDILKTAVEGTTARLEQMTAFIRGPEFNGALSILASTFAGFEKNGKESINSVENKLGNGLSDMNSANNKTLVNMANDWAEWSTATIAAVSTTVVVSLGWLEKLIINAQAAADVASNPLNVFGIAEALSKRQAALVANQANINRLQTIVDNRFDAQTAARTKANKEAAAAIEALKNKTAETGDQLARYGIAANAQQEKSAENTKKQAAAEKALAKQREKDARDRLKQLEDINRKLREDAKFVEDLRGEYDPFIRLEVEFKRRWSEIQSALSGASEETLKSVFAVEQRLLAQADAELQVSQFRRMEQYTDFLNTKEQRLVDFYATERVLAEAAFDLDEKQKQQAKESLDRQEKAALSGLANNLERQLAGIRQPFIDEIYLLTREAELAVEEALMDFDVNDAYRAVWIDAINERRDYEIAQIEFTRKKELDAASDHQKTELQLIEQRYRYEREELELNRAISDDVREARLTAINAKEDKAAFDLRDGANNAYQAQRADLGGYGAEYGLKQQFSDRLEVIQEAMDAEVITEQQALDAKLEARRAYENATRDLSMSSAEDIAGSLSSITKTMMGENSTAYRAMFAIEKGVAIARSIMNIQVAMSSAAASLPFPANLGAMATVATNVMGIISNIQAVRMPKVDGQAHNGIANVPREGTWMLDKGERVVKPADNRKLSDFLDGKGDVGGNGAVNITVENHTDATVRQERDPDGRIRLIVGEEVKRQAFNNRSDLHRGLNANYNMRRNLA